MPPKHALTHFRLKLETRTYFIPVTPSTTLSSLRIDFLAALNSTLASDPSESLSEPIPTDPEEVDLYALTAKPASKLDEELADEWKELGDEKSGADKWGLVEGAEIGVRFKSSLHTVPNVIRPVDDDAEE